jgi:cell division septation protein DedD
MNAHNLAKTLHFIGLKKIAVLCISALFIISMLSVFATTDAQAITTTSPLHTLGNQILDANNQAVILRGIGRTGDLQSASGMWSSPGNQVANWGQKWQPTTQNIPAIDATLQCYQQIWHINMIRILIPINWWWINNIAASNYQTGAPTTPISYRNYITTLTQEAQKYGIYVDVCPYNVFDAYTDYSGGNSNGIPGSLSTSAYNYMLSINSKGEIQAWQTWWNSIATTLGQYSNVIFEAWNEPATTGNSAVPSTYLTYLTTMYNTIRSTGSQNLIFMQWDAGYVPTYNDLSWATQITSSIPNEANLAFTTHVYRHAPYFNQQWATTYSTVKAQLQSAVSSMGVNAPLVINEAGSCMSTVSSGDVQNEVSWWDGLVHSAQDLGIGVTAYYWMSDSDLGPIYSGESLLTGSWNTGAASPTPNSIGQVFLNYAPTPIATPTPTATPTPAPAQTAAPAPTPVATPTHAPTNQTKSPTMTQNQTETQTAKVNQSSIADPTLKQTQLQVPTYRYHYTVSSQHWYIFSWPHFNGLLHYIP